MIPHTTIEGNEKAVELGVKHYNAVADEILAKLQAIPPAQNDVGRVLHFFHQRAISSIISIQQLDHRDDGQHDAAVLMRSLYDLHVQLLYIFQDLDVRAKEYLDFSAVDAFEFLKLVKKGGTMTAELIRHSPDFRKWSNEIEQRYNAVKHQFVKPDGGNRIRWYKEQICQLADKMQKGHECRMVWKLTSQMAHTSSSSMTAFSPKGMLVAQSYVLLLRILGGIAKHQGVLLSEQAQMTVDAAMQEMF